MKNVIYLLFVVFMSCSSKKEKSQDKTTELKPQTNQEAFVVISQETQDTKETQLILKKVVNDSRCPEGVRCIWAGEIELLIAIYKNNIFVSEEKVLLSPKNETEYLAWFAHYFPSREIKSVVVSPYPKDGVAINAKDYFVRVCF